MIYYPQAYYHNYLWIYPGPEQNDFQIQIVMKMYQTPKSNSQINALSIIISSCANNYISVQK